MESTCKGEKIPGFDKLGQVEIKHRKMTENYFFNRNKTGISKRFRQAFSE